MTRLLQFKAPETKEEIAANQAMHAKENVQMLLLRFSSLEVESFFDALFAENPLVDEDTLLAAATIMEVLLKKAPLRAMRAMARHADKFIKGEWEK